MQLFKQNFKLPDPFILHERTGSLALIDIPDQATIVKDYSNPTVFTSDSVKQVKINDVYFILNATRNQRRKLNIRSAYAYQSQTNTCLV